MSEQPKRRTATLARGGTIQLSDVFEKPSQITEQQREIAQGIAQAIKAYRKASQDLLNGKYAHLREYAPSYISDPGNAYIICCNEGVIIRHEINQGEQRVFTGWANEDMMKLARSLSEEVVFIGTHEMQDDLYNYGIEVSLVIEDLNGELIRPLERACISFHIDPEALTYKNVTDNDSDESKRPHCVFSLKNLFVCEMFGTISEEDVNEANEIPFVARSHMRLPVGWECFELYGPATIDQWKTENVTLWAENDLLSAIVVRQSEENEINTLDPTSQARKRYGNLLEEYKSLLDSNPQREQELHAYLQANPILLCPTKTKFWSKLPLGNRITDFVFRDAIGDYLLVELERSILPLFLKDGHFSGELNHARGQILDWKRYIEDNLSTVQRELGLSGISSNPRSLIVIGRSSMLSIENRRKLTAIENESPKTKVMTYDDIYEMAKTVFENILGPFWLTTGNTQIYYLPEN